MVLTRLQIFSYFAPFSFSYFRSLAVPAAVKWGGVEEIEGLGAKPPGKFPRPRPLNLRETPFFIVGDRTIR